MTPEMRAVRTKRQKRLLTHFTGDYTNMIITHLRALNVTPEDYNIKNSLWACVDHGEIVFSDLCTVGCVGGDSKEDYCAARGKSEGQEQGGEAVASAA
ncbi:hypothetical protein F5B21DRAFT_496539 [Xylaria acuta]|nr:hypothetical protein F5B21DRAFT_496539 [Xylaria acuta]